MTRVLTCAAGLLCALLGSCAQDDASTQFNDKIMEGSRRLVEVGSGFGSVLHPFLEGGRGDAATLRLAHATMVAELKLLELEMRDFEVPEGPGAREYLEEYGRFLGLQQAFLSGPYGEIMQIVDGPEPPSTETVARVGVIIDQAASREEVHLEALRKAQARFLAGY